MGLFKKPKVLEEWMIDDIDEGEQERVDLVVRCAFNGVTIVPHLVGDGRLLRSCAEHPWQPIHLAAMMGDLNVVRGLVQAAGPSLTAVKAGCSMRTPMVAAAKAGQVVVAKWLHRVGRGPVSEGRKERKKDVTDLLGMCFGSWQTSGIGCEITEDRYGRLGVQCRIG